MKKNKRLKKQDRLHNSTKFAGTDTLITSFAKKDRQGIEVLNKLASDIKNTNIKLEKIDHRNRAGFVAEIWHEGTFNAQAAKQGKKIRAELSKYGDSIKDINIKQGSKVIDCAQVKYESSAARSALSASKPRYEGTQRILPAEQALSAKDILKKSGEAKLKSDLVTKATKGKERLEAASKIKDTVQSRGVKSRPLKKTEAEALAQGDLKKLESIIRKDSISAEGLAGFKSGAVLGGVTSTLSNAKDYLYGEKEFKEAATDVAKDTLKAGVQGAAVNLTATALKKAAPKLIGKTIKSSPAVAVASGLVECATLAYKGELTAKKSAKVVGATASSWAAAETLGSFGLVVGGPVGGLVGGVMGGILGHLGFTAFFD